jgi:AsmA protein
VDIAAQALGGTVTLKGALAAPAALAGVDLAVAARLPDLAALSPLAGRSLPALRPVALDARIGDRDGGGIRQGVAVHGLALTTPAGDLAGDGALGFGVRPSLQATLSSRRIDADAIAAAMPPPTPLPPAPPPAAGPPPPPASGPARRIPDLTLPFAGLGRFDAELRLTVAELLSGGVTTSDLAATVALHDGKLAVEPVSGTLPGGRLELRLDVDAGAAPPPVSLVMHAPGLALKPLLAALRLPDDVAGTVEIDADLRGAGDTPRALAATLSGRLGVAMADGELDNRLLGLLLGELLRAAKLPVDVVGLAGARTRVHCLAARLDARDGIATVGTLVLDAGKLLLEGAGTVNLRDEGLSLRLRPLLRVGAPVVVPVRVGGTFAAPKFGSDAGGVAGALAGLAAGLAGGRGNPPGAAAGERGGDACPAALAAARAGGGR